MSVRAIQFIRLFIATLILIALVTNYAYGKEDKGVIDWVLDSQTFKTLFKIGLLILAFYLAWGRISRKDVKV